MEINIGINNTEPKNIINITESKLNITESKLNITESKLNITESKLSNDSTESSNISNINTINNSFDLNIDNILTNWSNAHAIREFIANAFDEQVLSKSKDIELFYNDSIITIRDYGRGIKPYHFILNENNEKKNNKNIIGQFGIGLKDAIATLYRNNCIVVIKSVFNIITFQKMNKNNFNEINTLHAIINENNDIKEGTLITIKGATLKDYNDAKKFFLKYNTNNLLETTKYGEIYEKKSDKANIYINGIKISSEDNFKFDYNITVLTKKIRNSLNRERNNLNKSVYSDSIKKIILRCKNEKIIDSFMEDLKNENKNKCDELKYVDVIKYITTNSKENKNCVYLTQEQMKTQFGDINNINLENKHIVLLPNNIYDKIKTDTKINTFEKYTRDINVYNYVSIDPNTLTPEEKHIFNKTFDILSLINAEHLLPTITISENITRNDEANILGLFVPTTKIIIIKRSQLKTLETYAGTLIHECIHAITNTLDITLEFENKLTQYLGIIANKYLIKQIDEDSSEWSRSK